MASRSINPAADGDFNGEKVYLGGYGAGQVSGRTAIGILGNGIFARAFAVSDGRNPLVIATADVQGSFVADKEGPWGWIDVRKEVARRTGGALKADQVFVQSNHTHGGPDTTGVFGGVPAAYRRFVAQQMTDAIVEAFKSMRPGRLYYGTREARDLQSNQFDYDEQNKVMDSEMRVLQARDDLGRPFATLLDWSAHPTVLGSSNRKATADWTQVANEKLEARYGGKVQVVPATLGRTQPNDRGCPDKSITEADRKNLCALDEYAGRVVERAAQAVSGARRLTGAPLVRSGTYYVQDLATNATIMGLDYAGAPAGVPVYRSLSPPWLTGNVLGTVTGSALIGDVLVSSIPGEAYPQIPLEVRRLVPAKGYMTIGLSEDQLGYLIAPFNSYPEPIRRTFFNQRGDQVDPISNDNYAFNVSHTMGERVICSLLRGAGDLLGKGIQYRAQHDTCGQFSNDLSSPEGADTR
jgi:hypothetical protein